MMSDIRSFKTLVEHLPPEQVVALLNRYLGKMTDIILRHGGTIDEFLGDAVLAAFGAPTESEEHATQAVTCAIEMQAAMAKSTQQIKLMDSLKWKWLLRSIRVRWLPATSALSAAPNTVL